MGVQVLAIAVWLGSLVLYGAAFFFPEVHRRHDFFWSGVGAFYGLVLWFSAVQTSPTEFLGHLASTTLLGWLGWQTLSLRRKRTPLDLQTPLAPGAWPAFGQRLKQSALAWLQATPLRRWLPEERWSSDPAIAIGEIRVSSLKEGDYEFVDELAPNPRGSTSPAAEAPTPASVVVAEPSPLPPAKARLSQPPAPRPRLDKTPSRPKLNPAGVRLAGFKAWVGSVFTRPAPKPKRTVIDIPPRPSSLAKQTQPAAKGKAEETSRSTPPGVTIINAEAVESLDEPERDNRANLQSKDQSTPEKAVLDAPAQQPSSAAEPLADDEAANWADDENWADS
ncbi:MAG: Ycf66 family protein [Nodosilinea sp.]